MRSVAGRAARAFSLVEVLVVAALMSVIILGLMAMFNQTQRAFRLGMSQTDVLENGRMTTELIVRDMGQIAPFGYPRLSNAPNFSVELFNAYNASLIPQPGLRTNVLNDVFFMVRENRNWSGVGYFVRTQITNSIAAMAGPVGTLYRFERQLQDEHPSLLVRDYDLSRLGRRGMANLARVLEGVVHFRVRVYDTNGFWINPFDFGTDTPIRRSVTLSGFPVQGEVAVSQFYERAVPAFVEVEIGVLERQALERYQAIPVLPGGNDTARRNYLQQQIGRVHVFRQRIPIRNVDFAAYQ
ncbi:MAG TPA: prepilin-type N-terminal cleavage/methylation domain-containing protein [Verrucomicrobiota bacterium]|nr:prepilin-type N-terminal cleavage/methylation domain-containing protein [Verrucomicrobiota bacterium]HPU57511.1 prepilin-type N-terminal cleavage/methylation domain-containing protein [Verrucomicrobiota bacterium]